MFEKLTQKSILCFTAIVSFCIISFILLFGRNNFQQYSIIYGIFCGIAILSIVLIIIREEVEKEIRREKLEEDEIYKNAEMERIKAHEQRISKKKFYMYNEGYYTIYDSNTNKSEIYVDRGIAEQKVTELIKNEIKKLNLDILLDGQMYNQYTTTHNGKTYVVVIGREKSYITADNETIFFVSINKTEIKDAYYMIRSRSDNIEMIYGPVSYKRASGAMKIETTSFLNDEKIYYNGEELITKTNMAYLKKSGYKWNIVSAK